MNSTRKVLWIILSYLSASIVAQNEYNGTFQGDQCGILYTLQNGEIKFPWAATIHAKSDLKDPIPAAILTPTLVIMNANHYFKDAPNLVFSNFSMYLASGNLTRFGETNKDNPYTQTVGITHIRLHPKIVIHKHWSFFNNDFALIHLKRPLVFDDQVHSMCLPTYEMVENILNATEGDVSVLVSGWRRYTTDYIYHNLTVNDEDMCKNWWKYGNDNETKDAPYIDRFCANITSGDSHLHCINRDTAVVGKVDSLKYYFLGLVNNFYSDNRTCTDNTRIFVNKVTKFNLQFIDSNIRCGPKNFTCDNGQCVPVESICNDQQNCEDGSDEDLLYCDAVLHRYCNDNQFRCSSGKRNCIKESQKCDGIMDCANGEDENCPFGAEAPVGTVVLSVAVISICLGILIYLWRRRMRGDGDYLTDKEVEEFLSGLKNTTDEQIKIEIDGIENNDGNESVFTAALTLPYDTSNFEIPRENLKIEWAKELGRGEFAVVYKAVFDCEDNVFDVAVKTFKASGYNSKDAFKSQLSELKIMSRIGRHDNIVNLIGAYTKEIKTRVLYIVVELCQLGSLHTYLAQNRDRFTDLIDRDGNFNPSKRPKLTRNSSTQYENILQISNIALEKPFTTLDLLLWAYQIASAMEYLASKKVSHGDLATRNILLTENYTAKLSDFGLSCDLYKMQDYKKKRKKTPVPLRWMATECLQDTTLQFSSESDIWSYGITIWEIFSLGQMPYPGIPVENIHDEIVNMERRPEEPDFGSKEIYAKMKECWNVVPNQRPKFSSLQTYFHGLYTCLDYVTVHGAL